MNKQLKKLLIVLLVIVIALFVSFVGVKLYLKSKYDKMTYKPIDTTDLGITQTNIPDESKKDETVKFVIFGSDSRDTDNAYAGRSDSIIIVNVNITKKSICFISIPRDSYVSVSGHGMTKINHAYAYGQEQLSIKTINENFGLDLTQYMTIDFSGLVNCINLVGGVDLNLNPDEVAFINARVDWNNKIPGAGPVTLNGTQALVHSRNRYVGNDFARAYRQRSILVSLLKKMSTKSVDEVLGLSDQILENITTNMDMNMYQDMFVKLAADRSEYLNNIISVQIPDTKYGSDSMIDGVYYFQYDKNLAIKDFQKYYYGVEEEENETEAKVGVNGLHKHN